MPPIPRPRTLLAHLLVQRHWTVEDFCRHYADTAASIGADTYGITDRQAKRWLAGTVTKPYPVARRVLQAMFNTDANALLSPAGPPPGGESERTAAFGIAPPPAAGDDGQTAIAPHEEVSQTRRRDLLSAGVLLTTGTALGSADRAARISRAIAATAPDPLTLAQLEHGVYQLAKLYDVTPLGTLVEPTESAWDRAETLLNTCRSGAGRRDLERLAGWYAYYAGRLAHSKNGDGQASLAFLVLAGQHADAAGDTLLSGSIADMRAALAFFAGQFTAAAAIARQALPTAHPYILPSLASQLARSLAHTGDTQGALTALRTVRDNVWQGEHLPGPAPSDEEAYEAYSAITLGYLGRGDLAEPHARRSLTLLTQTGRHLHLAGTHLALARAFVRRPKPEPEQATIALRDALTAARGNDHGRTIHRAAGIYHHLSANPNWSHLPTVRDLGERLPTPRALPEFPL